jgi:hypothetical protein
MDPQCVRTVDAETIGDHPRSCPSAACYPDGMADEYTPEQIAQLEAQVAYFRSDDRIRERAALWRDASPAECWATVRELCEDTAFWIDRYPDRVRELALAQMELPADTIALLESMHCR